MEWKSNKNNMNITWNVANMLFEKVQVVSDVRPHNMLNSYWSTWLNILDFNSQKYHFENLKSFMLFVILHM